MRVAPTLGRGLKRATPFVRQGPTGFCADRRRFYEDLFAGTMCHPPVRLNAQ